MTPSSRPARLRHLWRRIADRWSAKPRARAQDEKNTAIEAEVAHLRETFQTQLDHLMGRMPEDIAKLRKDLLAQMYAARWNTLDRLNALAPAPETLTCTVCEHVGRTEDFVIQVSSCIFGGANCSVTAAQRATPFLVHSKS
jgi:hypothetical protein